MHYYLDKANVKGDIEHRNVLSLELCKKMVDDFTVFAGVEISKDGEDRYHWLEEQMTFMYR